MVGWHRHVQSILLHVGKRAENICYTHATFSTSPLKFSPLQEFNFGYYSHVYYLIYMAFVFHWLSPDLYITISSTVMAGAAPEGSQFDTRHFDSKMNELISTDGQDFFTSYDEVYDIFDAMGLQENLLRGIYAYEGSHSFRAFILLNQ
ncbi:uncharacterized protein LOC110929677 isoform X2 [Helianthus annuus]|uniref:uncharacterized protein LOC110929677 isoform X2 n=1 Tax=Helianthus annuus TaxID=4232 RepID=UPI000B907AED|nr:uncharacterized protein LOC110929677 isoform X2 [Helianthus annuus]